jgi:hypothetical protein
MMLCVVRLPNRSDVLKVHMREMTMMPFIDAQPRRCYDGMMMQMFPLIGDLAVLEHDGHAPETKRFWLCPGRFTIGTATNGES